MPACSVCSTDVASGARFCPSCGAAQVATPPQPPPQPQGQPYPQATAVAPASGLSVNNWMMLCHLSALAGLLIPSLGHLLGPLVVWLVKKDELPQVDVEGKESLNFQISMTIYMLISSALIWVLIGIPMLVIVALTDIVLTLIAATKASQGVMYRYPLTIRFLK
jgi:uncharacterized Tic20 family protein